MDKNLLQQEQLLPEQSEDGKCLAGVVFKRFAI